MPRARTGRNASAPRLVQRKCRNADCPTCGAEDAALEDCAQYKGEQENEPNDTQEPAEPQKEDREGDQEAQPEETKPTEEPAAPAEPTVQEKPQVAAKVAANNKAVAVQAAEHKHCFCGGSVNAGDHASHEGVTYTACTKANYLRQIFWIEKVDVAYAYLENDMTLDYNLSIQEGKTLYLCLNGHTLNLGEYTILVGSYGAKLYLCDCSAQKTGTVSGGGSKGCVSVYDAADYKATFNMYGGTLRGGNRTGTGGGVNVEIGTMNMYGGTITENTATSDGGGIYVGAKSALNLYGGTITKNTVSTNEGHHGGGVYVESNEWSGVGKISISGSPVITGNTRTYTDAKTGASATTTENLYLSYGFYNSGKFPTITLGTLTGGANIGISTGLCVFSTANETDYSKYFSSDDTGYHVEYNAEKKLELKSGAAHTHTGGTATCTKKAVCETCGKEYGELNPTNHSGTLGNWQTSDTEHWQVYSCCKVEANRAAHSGGTADCQHKAVCTTCGGKYGDVDPTNHTGTQGEWKSDGDKHWKEYSCCGVKVAEGTHAFTAEKAEEQYLKSGSTCEGQAEYYKSCDTCGLSSKGLKDEATFFSGNVLGHDYGIWTSNGDGTHTRVCSRDSSHTESGTCSGGTATCTKRAVCSACGGEYGKMEAHDFTAEKAEEQYQKSAATCTEKAVYYKSCIACGLTSKDTEQEDTFESGDPLNHDFSNWNSNGKDQHTRTCQRQGCDYTETDDCDGGTATCTEPATCTVCGGTYGELAAHDFTAEVAEAKYLKTEATCTEQAVYYKSCKACGLASEDTFQSGNPLGHDYGAWKSNGDGTHTRICSNDSSHTETDDCSGGTATCTELATCTTCGETYGELAAHDFTAEVAEEDYLKSEATCTEAAVYYKSCTACGLASEDTEQEDTFQSGDPLGHDYDTKWSQDETHHWHVCQRCQDIADLEAHTASGWITDTAATAKADGEKHKECTVCGYILETDTIPATGSKTKPGKQDNTKTRIKINAPKTGDDSSLLLWTALLGVSGVGVTGVVRYGRKRKDNE